MEQIDLSNPVLAVALLTQQISKLEEVAGGNEEKLDAEGKTKQSAEQKAKQSAEGKTKQSAEQKAKQSAEGKTKQSAEQKAELSECLRKRGGLLMAMGDKEGAEKDMKRFLELNPEKVGELNGEFKAEGREHCR